MQVILSKHAGFCEGVRRAYEMVEKIAQDPSIKRPIFVFGSLVHNEEVVARIENLGVRRVDIEGTLEDFFEKNRNRIGTLVITAHGSGPKIYKLAKDYQIDLADTTCPRVIKVQRLAKNFAEKGFQLVIIGEKNHKEVEGIFEWGGKSASFVETEEDLQALNLDPGRKIAVLSQTTQDREFVKRAAAQIAEKYPNVKILDSICLATHDRQTELGKLAEENEVVIVIGDPKSSNSKRLWEVAARINKDSYFIRNAKELDLKWFKNKKTVAVTAGASTPKWIIEEVVDKLQAYSS